MTERLKGRRVEPSPFYFNRGVPDFHLMVGECAEILEEVDNMFAMVYFIDKRYGKMGMTEEEIKKLEDLYNTNVNVLVACEDNEDKIHYRGKLLGINLALDTLGYTPKEYGAKETYPQMGVKPIEYHRYKIVRKEEDTFHFPKEAYVCR